MNDKCGSESIYNGFFVKMPIRTGFSEIVTKRHPCQEATRLRRGTIRTYPMVLGYHFIFSAYGFWLPNDPRGSWSDTIRSFEHLKFGPATKVTTTQSLARRPHDAALRRRAKEALRYRPVRFSGIQGRAIARGFALAAGEGRYMIHALAILPDHAHLVMLRHSRHIDEIAAHLKARATRQMSIEGSHPLAKHASTKGRIPSPWSRNYWCPFILSIEHMREAILYVERNPIKAGLRAQRWRCVVPYEGHASRRSRGAS